MPSPIDGLGRFVLGLGIVAGALPALASEIDGLKLARDNACLACHQVDARRVGPPFAAIGERYAQSDDTDAAQAYLAGAIRQGGRGRWGAIPMPAQPQVSQADARALAEWILALPADDK